MWKIIIIKREEINEWECNIVIVILKEEQSLKENVKEVFTKFDSEIKREDKSVLSIPNK